MGRDEEEEILTVQLSRRQLRAIVTQLNNSAAHFQRMAISLRISGKENGARAKQETQRRIEALAQHLLSSVPVLPDERDPWIIEADKRLASKDAPAVTPLKQVG